MPIRKRPAEPTAVAVDTTDVPSTTALADVTPAAAAPPAPAAGGLQPPGYDASGFLCGSIYTPAPPHEATGPRDRPREASVEAFKPSGEQLAALVPPPLPTPAQPPPAGWQMTLSGVDVIRGQVATMCLNFSSGRDLAAEIVARRQRDTSAANAKLLEGGNTGKAAAALVAELTAALDKAEQRLEDHMSGPVVRTLLREVLSAQLALTDGLTLRSRCRG